MTGVKLPNGEVRIRRTTAEKVVFGAIGIVLTAFMGANVRSIMAESGRTEEVKTVKADVAELKDDRRVLQQINERLSRIEGRLGVKP